MCCGDKCLGFIPVKIASLIFGYIIAIISAIGSIVFLVGIFIGFSIGAVIEVVVATPILMEFTSSFICSVLLLVGLTQKRPQLVKIFLIYGMIQVALLLVFFIVLRCASYWFHTDHMLMAFSTLVIYSLCLYMVYVQYQCMIVDVEPKFENLQRERGGELPVGNEYILAP